MDAHFAENVSLDELSRVAGGQFRGHNPGLGTEEYRE
jgi:hypothetical protein